jgi:hypothetical protein
LGYLEDKQHDLTSFYGVFNIIFEFIEKNYGFEELGKYWEFIGEKYYSKFIEDIKERGTEAIKDYWISSCQDDKVTSFSYEIDDEKFELKIDRCSAIEWIGKNPHYKLFDKYCDHCRVINSKIASLSGFEYKLENNRDKWKCIHNFKNKEIK